MGKDCYSEWFRIKWALEGGVNMKKYLGLAGVAVFLLMFMVACGNDDDEKKVTFNVEILEIHEEPQNEIGYGTILAVAVEVDGDDGPSGRFTFNHTYLSDIGAEVGDIVTITVHSPWIEPDPAPVYVYSWELAE